MTSSETNARDIIKKANNSTTFKSVLKLEFEILKELEFDVNKPTIIDFQMLLTTLLKPHDKI